MTETVVTQAKSDAMQWASAARNRVGEPPPTTDDLDRERLAGLAASCPATRLAGAVAGWPVVALDADTMRPSSGPLGTAEAVWAHFRHRRDDAVGLELGEMPGGVTTVAQRATAVAWQQWQRAVGVEVRRRTSEYGRTFDELTPLPLPRFTSLTWQPPAGRFRSSGVQLGKEALARAGRAMGPDAAPAEPGWLLFAAAPLDGRSLVFRDRKADQYGVAVQATGIVPLYARRADGTTLTASLVPQVDEMPEWLLVELGGRLGKRRP